MNELARIVEALLFLSAEPLGVTELAGAAEVSEGEVVEALARLRERYEELRADEAAIEAALGQGADKARAIASNTMVDVRRRMGVGPPS